MGQRLETIPKTSLAILGFVLCLSTLAGSIGGYPNNFWSTIEGLKFISVVTFSVLLTAFLLMLISQFRRSLLPRFMAVGAGFIVVAVIGGYPTLLWGTSGGLHVEDDQVQTQQGYSLGRVTKEDATVAVIWAGAPSYYSQRAMIDLLGKSDPVVAYSKPIRNFYPGHNKMDLAYSVEFLRPDVVFEPGGWVDISQLLEWGYVERCLGPTVRYRPSYFLEASDQVRWDELVEC
jgi:hypothetical protein